MASYFTLFYFSDGERSANLKSTADSSRYAVYVRNALLLASSIRSHADLTVLTNDADRYRGIVLNEVGDQLAIKVKEIEFKLDVPKILNFYSAHFKIDAIRYICSLQERCFPCALVDSDMVWMGSNGADQALMLTSQDIACYNISSHVFPAYGRTRVMHDIHVLTQGRVSETEGHWYGGEFLAFGSPSVVQALLTQIDAVWPIYIAKSSEVHHQGDEAVVTAALNLLRTAGSCVRETGKDEVLRYWSGRVLHHQVSLLSIIKFQGWLHLPQDKGVLSAALKHRSLLRPWGMSGRLCYGTFVLVKRTALRVRDILRRLRP